MGAIVDFPSNGHNSSGYLATPASDGPYPALIAIQEWWGLVGHIKDVADRFVSEGFVALAPDLYHGQTTTEPNEARKLAMALDRQNAVSEIISAANYLRSLPAAQSKVGIVGWCMGGGLALTTAASSDNIDAVVCFYGRPLDARDTAKIKAPVLGLYGELDAGIPQSTVQDFEKQLERNGTTHEFHTYAGAGHAFFNNDREAYHPEAAEDAWKRALAWLRKYLQ